MPTHTIVPYKLGVREKGEGDNYRDLNTLTQSDPNFPDDDIISYLDRFLQKYNREPEEDEDNEKTFRVEEHVVRDDVIEGIIRTGDYGYSAVLRDIETGEEEKKEETQAEELPFHFILYVPKTTQGNYYENGEEAVIVFQTINRRGVKSTFTKLLEEEIQRHTNDSVLEMEPVFSQNVLEKVISSNRILSAEFEYKEVPDDDEGQYRLIEGMDTQDTGSTMMVYKPKRGKSLNFFKDRARELRQSGGNFAELVADNVEDLKVKIQKEDGSERKISLLNNELKMREHLNFGRSDLDEGLPTEEAISRESRRLVNRLYPNQIVEELEYRTILRQHVAR